mgnify:CR=1 FL=1
MFFNLNVPDITQVVNVDFTLRMWNISPQTIFALIVFYIVPLTNTKQKQACLWWCLWIYCGVCSICICFMFWFFLQRPGTYAKLTPVHWPKNKNTVHIVNSIYIVLVTYVNCYWKINIVLTKIFPKEKVKHNISTESLLSN